MREDQPSFTHLVAISSFCAYFKALIKASAPTKKYSVCISRRCLELHGLTAEKWVWVEISPPEEWMSF